MRIIFVLSILMLTNLFASNDFQQIYSVIEQRLHPSFVVILISDDNQELYIGGKKRKSYFNTLDTSALNYLYEPGKTLFPLLIAYDDRKNFDYFYDNKKIATYAKHLSQKKLRQFLIHYHFNQAILEQSKKGKKPFIPNLNSNIQKQTLGLGYGILLTPLHLLNAYIQAIKEDDSIRRFMLLNAKNYYNIFKDNIGVVGTIARKAKKKGYSHTFVLSYYGFIDIHKKRYYIALVTQFDAPTNHVDSRNFIGIYWDIVNRLKQ